MSERAGGNGQVESLPPRGTGRRRSLIFLAVLLIGLPVAFVLRAALDEGWRQISTVAALEEEDVIYAPELGVFLVDGDPPIALVEDSPHVEDDPVAYCRSAGAFQERHGGLFDRHGFYLDGPPERGLDRVASRVRDGVVEINVSIVTEGPERGAGPPEQPTGPFCFFEDPSDGADGFLAPPDESV